MEALDRTGALQRPEPEPVKRPNLFIVTCIDGHGNKVVSPMPFRCIPGYLQAMIEDGWLSVVMPQNSPGSIEIRLFA